jgi:hypothetical protein
MRLAVAAAFVFEGLIDPSAIRSQLRKGVKIGAKPFISRCAVLEAFEIGFQLGRGV